MGLGYGPRQIVVLMQPMQSDLCTDTRLDISEAVSCVGLMLICGDQCELRSHRLSHEWAIWRASGPSVGVLSCWENAHSALAMSFARQT